MPGMVTGGFEKVAENEGGDGDDEDQDEDGDGDGDGGADADGDGGQGEGGGKIVDGDDAPMEISDGEQSHAGAQSPPVAVGGEVGAAKQKSKQKNTKSKPGTDSPIPSPVTRGVEKLEIVEGKEFVEADKKRLDVIAMIRQAKAKAAADKAKQDSVAANADFISLNFDDEKPSSPPESGGGDDGDDLAQDRRKMRRLNDSSKAPPDRPHDRPFSHKEAIHGVYVPKQPVDDGPPGVGPLSRAAKLPPPPGLDARRPKWKKRHHHDSASDSCSGDDGDDDDGADDDEYDTELLPISTDQIQAHHLDVPLARKRKYDEISKNNISGNIKYELRPKPGVNPIPWNADAKDHSRTLHMSAW